jgi:hypothetical protein
MKVEEVKKQYKLLHQFYLTNPHSGSEVIKWVSSCVAFFSSIGVNGSIISGFMRTFEPKTGSENPLSSTIGPFVSSSGMDRYSLKGTNKYSISSSFETGNIYTRTVYIDIAFQTAKNILGSLEESERLIPNSLINSLKSNLQYSQISSSLELMEVNFENKDSIGLATNAISLLSSIFNLEMALAGKPLSNQIRQVKSTKELLIKFGVRPEVLIALDNSRILRNYLSSHKNLPIEYNVPFAVSLGTAYLVIMFLQITMATGVLIT